MSFDADPPERILELLGLTLVEGQAFEDDVLASGLTIVEIPQRPTVEEAMRLIQDRVNEDETGIKPGVLLCALLSEDALGHIQDDIEGERMRAQPYRGRF